MAGDAGVQNFHGQRRLTREDFERDELDELLRDELTDFFGDGRLADGVGREELFCGDVRWTEAAFRVGGLGLLLLAAGADRCVWGFGLLLLAAGADRCVWGFGLLLLAAGADRCVWGVGLLLLAVAFLFWLEYFGVDRWAGGVEKRRFAELAWEDWRRGAAAAFCRDVLDDSIFFGFGVLLGTVCFLGGVDCLDDELERFGGVVLRGVALGVVLRDGVRFVAGFWAGFWRVTSGRLGAPLSDADRLVEKSVFLVGCACREGV